MTILIGCSETHIHAVERLFCTLFERRDCFFFFWAYIIIEMTIDISTELKVFRGLIFKAWNLLYTMSTRIITIEREVKQVLSIVIS